MQTTARRKRLRELLERAFADMDVSEEEWVRAVRRRPTRDNEAHSYLPRG